MVYINLTFLRDFNIIYSFVFTETRVGMFGQEVSQIFDDSCTSSKREVLANYLVF